MLNLTKFIGLVVLNTSNEEGVLVAVEPRIEVQFETRLATFTTTAFEKGYLTFKDAKTQLEVQNMIELETYNYREILRIALENAKKSQHISKPRKVNISKKYNFRWNSLPYRLINRLGLDKDEVLLHTYYAGNAEGMFYLPVLNETETRRLLTIYNKAVVESNLAKIAKNDANLGKMTKVMDQVKLSLDEKLFNGYNEHLLNSKDLVEHEVMLDVMSDTYNESVMNYNTIIITINGVKERNSDKLKFKYKFRKLTPLATLEDCDDMSPTWLKLQRYKLTEILAEISESLHLKNTITIDISNYNIPYNYKWQSEQSYVDYIDEFYRDQPEEEIDTSNANRSTFVDWNLYVQIQDRLRAIIAKNQIVSDTLSDAQKALSLMVRCKVNPSASLNDEMSKWIETYDQYKANNDTSWMCSEDAKYSYAYAQEWLKTANDVDLGLYDEDAERLVNSKELNPDEVRIGNISIVDSKYNVIKDLGSLVIENSSDEDEIDIDEEEAYTPDVIQFLNEQENVTDKADIVKSVFKQSISPDELGLLRYLFKVKF